MKLEIGTILQHGNQQVQIFAIDNNTRMAGIQYLNGIRSAIHISRIDVEKKVTTEN